MGRPSRLIAGREFFGRLTSYKLAVGSGRRISVRKWCISTRISLVQLARPLTFAIACVLARVPVLVLNEWLGHATLGATLVYTKIMCADSRRYLDEVDFG